MLYLAGSSLDNSWRSSTEICSALIPSTFHLVGSKQMLVEFIIPLSILIPPNSSISH